VLLARVALVHANPSPLTPAPGDVFNEGADCHIDWTADPTGLWTTMNIELMCGDNIEMVYMNTVATVDGTNPNNASFTYACPSVTLNAPIYFYQFTTANSASPAWTGRFTIADASGKSTAAPNATQPDGEAIPWGTAALVNTDNVVPQPAYGQNATAASTSTSTSSNTGPPVAGLVNATTASNGSLPSSGEPSTSGANSATGDSANAAPGALAVDRHLFSAAVALAFAALTFAVAL